MLENRASLDRPSKLRNTTASPSSCTISLYLLSHFIQKGHHFTSWLWSYFNPAVHRKPIAMQLPNWQCRTNQPLEQRSSIERMQAGPGMIGRTKSNVIRYSQELRLNNSRRHHAATQPTEVIDDSGRFYLQIPCQETRSRDTNLQRCMRALQPRLVLYSRMPIHGSLER